MNGLRIFVVVAIALVVGAFAYHLGLSQGLATTIPAGAAPVAYYGYPHWGLGLRSPRAACRAARPARPGGGVAVGTVARDGAVTAGSASRSCTVSCTARSQVAIARPQAPPSIASMKTVLVADDATQ